MDHDAAQALYVAGTMPFILLGFAHGVYTWVERTRAFRLSPRNPDVRRTMMETGLKIHPTANLWRAWLGFNFSHSLGAMVFGVFYLELALLDFNIIANNGLLLGLPVVFSGCLVMLAWRYWFIHPLIGTAMGFVCFAAGAALSV